MFRKVRSEMHNSNENLYSIRDANCIFNTVRTLRNALTAHWAHMCRAHIYTERRYSTLTDTVDSYTVTNQQYARHEAGSCE